VNQPATADPGPQLKNAENLCLALLYDLTAAMAKQMGVPDRRYALPALIRDRVLDPWARMAAYCAPAVLARLRSALVDFESSPWRAITEADVQYVHLRTPQRELAPTRVRTTLTGLRIKASLVSPDGVRRPPQHFDFDLQVEVDLGSGYLTELLVLPR
jgi:hypothetical protein